MSTDKDLLFVYGTLRTGHVNWHYYLAPRKGRPAVAPFLAVRGGLYPNSLLRAYVSPFHHLEGELFEVEPHEWEALDRLEGVKVGLYRLALRPVYLKSCPDQWLKAWVYLDGRDFSQPFPQSERESSLPVALLPAYKPPREPEPDYKLIFPREKGDDDE